MARPRALVEADGRLVENITHFTRALRKAGIKVGPAQLETAVRAVEVAGFTRPVDFYHVLRATLITRAEHLDLFHQIFVMFWRDPDYLERLIRLMSPDVKRDAQAHDTPRAGERRAAEALADTPPPPRQQRETLEFDAAFSQSTNEVLRAMDFDQMSAAETEEAARAIATLRLPVPPLRSRRSSPSGSGGVPDLRATLRASLRRAGEIDRLLRRTLNQRPPDLVALCDISGSMSAYSRMMMIFLHALAAAPGNSWGRVSAFTFGTRLSNVSRAIRTRDVDAALQAVGREAQDWEGGTRIGVALQRFNRDWSRRLLGRGAVVLLITDGLERDSPDLLAAEAARLSRSCRRLIWLNPLLRFQDFQPEARGIRALLPHVDTLRACHSLDSLAAIVALLAAPEGTPTSRR